MKLREITEAKYHGSNITVDQVSDMYWEVYEGENNRPGFEIRKPRLYETGAIMSIHVWTRQPQKAVDLVKEFLKEKNLPYTDIEIDEYKGTTVIVKYIDR